MDHRSRFRPIARAVLAAAGLFGLGTGLALAQIPPGQSGLVDTNEGPIQGVRDGSVMSWKGVPFAAPPVGELRWKRPQPAAKRAELLQTTSYRSACPQSEPDLLGNAPPPLDEDCLYLNVWSGANRINARLPVMFWIHGGGFANGSGGEALYNGANLAGLDVVVVTINYRLGALGFLAHPSFIGEDDAYPDSAGNYGLWDQIQALKWVKANIAGFGGDPERITIFGQSAGGVSVCALLASPRTDGLFVRAIMHSGNCLEDIPALDGAHNREFPSRQRPAVEQGRRFAGEIGCGEAAEVAGCMRTKTVTDVVNTLPAVAGLLQAGEHYGPILDGAVLDNPPGIELGKRHARPVAFILGATGDDGSIFTRQFDSATPTQYEAFLRLTFGKAAEQVLTLYPTEAYTSPRAALSSVLTDSAFVCPARRAAGAYKTSGHTAFLYYFTYVSLLGQRLGLGAYHGSDLPFVFGHLPRVGPDRVEPLLSDTIQQYWTTFADTGTPDADSPAPAWPIYDPSRRIALEIASNPRRSTDFRRQKCDLWDSIAAGQRLPPAGRTLYVPWMVR